MTVLTIAGSPVPHSPSSRLVEFAAARLIERGTDVDQLNIRELPPEALLRLNHEHPLLQRSLAWVARASAIIVATPVYRAAYTGLLKAFLDLLPPDAFKGKVLLPIATAGSPAHGLVLDYALNPVLSALGARNVLRGVFALDHQVTWAPETGLQLDPEIDSQIDEGIQRIADNTGSHSGSVSPAADSFFPSYDLDPTLERCWD
jgi:FMN reductase